VALTEQVILDIQSAERQITALESQLSSLGTPINVPVQITGEQDLENIRADLGQSETAVAELNRELGQTDDALRDVGTQAGRTGDAMDDIGTRGTSAFTNLRGAVVGVTAAFAAIQGARAFIDFARDAIDAASDLEESTSKAQVVFGAFFDDIQAFAATGPQALGLANQEALEFAATFGNLFTALGLTQQEAAELSPQIVQLGADLASFNNIDVTEALEKLRSGLVGEAEPLRTLGVNINAAVVEAKALELGLVDVTGEVTEAGKVQARYALILEQTTNAQGDFARTADGIANSQRTLNAEFTEFTAQVGEALLPAFQELLGSGEELLPTIESLIPVVGLLAGAAIDAVQAFEPFAEIIGAIVQPAEDLIGAFEEDVDTSNLDQLSEGARDLFENLDETLPLVREIVRLAQTGIDEAGFRDIFTQLADDLAAGIAPLEAGTTALESIITQGTFTQEVLDGLLTTLNLSTTEALQLFRALARGDLGPLTPRELELVNELLRELRLELADTGTEAEGTGRKGRGAADGIRDIAEAAAEAVPLVNIAAQSFADFTRGIETDQILADIDELEAAFQQLPDGLDAAAAAMRTEEGEIETDFDKFLANLRDELARTQEFNAGIDILEGLGLDNLAQFFRDAGIESLELLRDGLTDPAALQAAEDALDANAAILAGSFAAEFGLKVAEFVAIEGQKFGLIEMPAVEIPFVPVVRPPDFSGIFAGEGPTGNLGFEITQNFNVAETPTSDRARAAQAINGVVTGNIR
jgi:hypothetical protein